MKTVRFYLAGSAYNRGPLCFMAAELTSRMSREGLTAECTSRWLSETGEAESVFTRAPIDFADIDSSDVLIGTYPFGPGTSAEMAYAHARGVPVLYYKPNFALHLDEHDDPLIVGLGVLMRDDYICSFARDLTISASPDINAVFAACTEHASHTNADRPPIWIVETPQALTAALYVATMIISNLKAC